MSAAGEAKAKEDTLASGAKPRPEGRVRERGWRPTYERYEISELCPEAARRRTIAREADNAIRRASATMTEAEA
jgi:hypothetical protein